MICIIALSIIAGCNIRKLTGRGKGRGAGEGMNRMGGWKNIRILSLIILTEKP